MLGALPIVFVLSGNIERASSIMQPRNFLRTILYYVGYSEIMVGKEAVATDPTLLLFQHI